MTLRRLWIAVAGAVFITSVAAQPHAAVYGPDLFGVRFRYPATFTQSAPLPSYLGGPADDPGQPPAVVLTFTGRFPKSDFGGAAFSYSMRHGVGSAACAKIGSDAGESKPETLHGIRYTHVSASDAAMMHQRSDELYTTWHDGECYVFDLAFLTGGFGAREGIRQTTRAERRDVERQMFAILKSVQIGPVVRP